jgi:tRNA(fMet)-specific endonuclease VapC
MHLCVIDSDILSEIIKQKQALVVHRAQAYLHQHQQFAFSAVTRYEILRGLKDKGAIGQQQRFAAFCANSLIFAITDAILDRTADLWVAARKRGLPRRDSDLIIASTALEHGRDLVTGNTAHFSWIPGLIIDDWRRP